MGRPKKGHEYKSDKRYFVRETLKMRELMVRGRERWPGESDGEIIRRYMDYGGRCLALLDTAKTEREKTQNTL